MKVCAERRLSGTDMEGRPAAYGLDEIREAIVYPVSRPRHVLDIPYVRQKPDLCGEACVQMVTTFLGRPISQDKVNEAGGLDGKRGCHAEELVTALRKLDVKIVSEKSWPGVTDDDCLADRVRLIACLRDHHPVLLGVSGHYQPQPKAATFDHMVLLVGYDLVGERFIIHDPGRWPQWEISFPAFVHHRKNASGRLCQVEFALFRTWNTAANAEFPATLVALGERTIRVQPAAGDAIELPIDALRENELFKRLLAERDRIVAEFLTQATTMLLDRLGKTHAVVSSADDPYVVIAAGGAAAGKQTTGILRTIADLHGKTLFTNQARGGFIVVLTDDAEAFAALRGGGPEASGSAGFYNHGTRTLVIRRGTGTGTIAHEFTHALHFADMEALGQIHPIWIREGLGSLYEESAPRADRLVGLVNWRLPLLKKALAEGRTFPLRAFLENSERCFTEQTGVAYAMARYLCFFLQEKQVLVPWYARYCRNFADDRNGVRSLEEAYGKPLDQIEADWIEFVKSLP